MKNENMTIYDYLISFLFNETEVKKYVRYETVDNINDITENVRLIIIRSNFFDDDVYRTQITLPKTPFSFLPDSDIPFLFGESKIDHVINCNGQDVIVLYADLVASSFFLLSRYEELLKPECRDRNGRFLAKDSIIFQQGYGMYPLVDVWGRYLRNLLRQIGVELIEEKKGFKKIYLTHDVDNPFLFYRRGQVFKQLIKNIIHRGKKIEHPFFVYRHPETDPQNTFEKIIKVDTRLQNNYEKGFVESIYFLIAAGSKKTKAYCDIKSKKYQELISRLHDSGATLGLHVSYEAGENPSLIKKEMKRLLTFCPKSCTKSRHHFLHWSEAEHIVQMEQGGITEDFTLEYADSVGFRVGTCRPYYFINPKTKQVTNVLEHPMQIMECSLDRKNYMGLRYEEALTICKQLIDTTYDYNGELVLLFHNPIWDDNSYYGQLYENLLYYIMEKQN